MLFVMTRVPLLTGVIRTHSETAEAAVQPSKKTAQTTQKLRLCITIYSNATLSRRSWVRKLGQPLAEEEFEDVAEATARSK